MVTDEEILDAYRFLAENDGVFCEPASAASVAGVIKKAKDGYFKNGDVVVCTLTGHGLKDPTVALSFDDDVVTVDPDLGKIVEVMGV